MCPLWPLHIFLTYALALGPLWLVSYGVIGAAADAVSSSSDVKFEPETVKQVKVGKNQLVKMKFKNSEMFIKDENNGTIVKFEYYSQDPYIAKVFPETILTEEFEEEGSDAETAESSVSFNVTGNFLGYTEICAKAIDTNNNTQFVKCIDVSVIREPRVIDKAFTYSVASLVTILYVNMGAALDTRIILETIKRPIGPAIGLFTQFMFMPLLSYGLAKLLIPIAALQLGLFITGCSPGGGASNIWTLTLGGNLDLSITMTTISTFSAFAMMPLWILTLGSTIFDEANLTIPYSKIATFAVALVVPLITGMVIQFKSPKFAKFLVKIMKPFAVFLIIFIVVFAVYTNIYLFKLFTWQILLSGMLLPWLGYLLGGGTAMLLKQDWRDVIAISIETGVQNTGLAIFCLRFSLPQPEADLTTALPVAVAIMTPVIPTLIFLFHKVRGRHASGFTLAQKEDSMTPSVSIQPSV